MINSLMVAIFSFYLVRLCDCVVEDEIDVCVILSLHWHVCSVVLAILSEITTTYGDSSILENLVTISDKGLMDRTYKCLAGRVVERKSSFSLSNSRSAYHDNHDLRTSRMIAQCENSGLIVSKATSDFIP